MSEDDRLMNVKEVAQFLTVSIRKVWRDAAAGVFPQPIKLGPKTARWRLSEVLEYVEKARRSNR
jgi:predicted DNA-binding transcriptional regulator AlpA